MSKRFVVVLAGLTGLGGAAASMCVPCSPTLRYIAFLLFGTAGVTLLGIGVFGGREAVDGCVRAMREELFLD